MCAWFICTACQLVLVGDYTEGKLVMNMINIKKISHHQTLLQLLYSSKSIILPLFTGFGLASHFGVLCDIPCIGVAKNLFYVDGLQKSADFKEKVIF